MAIKAFVLIMAMLFASFPTATRAADTDSLLSFMPAFVLSSIGKTQGVKAVIGDNTAQASQVIGSQGGTISVTSGPLAGVKVVVPAGAVDADTTFTLSNNSGSLTPVAGTASGRLLDIHSSGATAFNPPLSVTVPYDRTSSVVPVPYFVDANGYLEPCQVTAIDRTAGTVTYDVFHTSLFTEIWAHLTGEGGVTTYRPENNGFQIANYGSIYNRSGECFGMSAFAQWYFRNKTGQLYPQYMQDIEAAQGTIKGQNVIATRAHISLSQQWNSYIPTITAQSTLSDEDVYASITNTLTNTKLPCILYLSDNEQNSTWAHAVLAYDYSASSGKIAINDPNYPGDRRTAQYDTSAKAFDNYDGYRGLALVGSGSFVTEPLENIYQDAQAGFNGSGDAQVQITSHTSGQTVDTRTVTLTGKIESGQILVTKLILTLNGTTPFEGPVDSDGNFSIPVSLSQGENRIHYTTMGKNAEGYLKYIRNNQMGTFNLNLQTAKSVITATLTWNTNNTDVDLYVIDPTGDVSWYGHKNTADGGKLDYDDTNGYGPEHWTLLNTDTIRWGQTYRVRVHYYSDHSGDSTTIPSTYTVNVVLYEGTDRATTASYTGVLSVDNSSNSSPSSTGPDWANVLDIIPVQSTSNGQPQIIRSPTGMKKLLVPVSNDDLAPKQESPPRQ